MYDASFINTVCHNSQVSNPHKTWTKISLIKSTYAQRVTNTVQDRYNISSHFHVFTSDISQDLFTLASSILPHRNTASCDDFNIRHDRYD